MSDAHSGACFCGAVRLEASGAPLAMGYCHCQSCRSWSGAPVVAFTLWPPENVRITAGEEHLGSYSKTGMTVRRFCSKCGGSVMADHPELGLADIFASTLPTLHFVPTVHVNYGEHVLPIHDGLLKLKDFPAEHGGSGEILPE